MKPRTLKIVGAFLVLGISLLVWRNLKKPEIKQQESFSEQSTSVSSKTVPLAKAKIRQRSEHPPVEITLGGFKSSWNDEK